MVGGCPTPNFYMPMLSPSQQAPHPGGSCIDVHGKQNQQQPILHTQQQVCCTILLLCFIE
ncbi:hypothetical protein Hanom_Chr16g01441631 [Helianthus anomalus]